MTDLADWSRTRTTPFAADELLALRERARLLADNGDGLLNDALRHLSHAAGAVLRNTTKGN